MLSNDRNAVSTVDEESLTTALKADIHSTSVDVLLAAASDPALTEDFAMALLKRSDLPSEALDRLGRNGGAMKSRKVKLTLIAHPKTPRHVYIPMVRHLFTFDLMQVALRPAVPADIKMVAEEPLIGRLEKVSAGERLAGASCFRTGSRCASAGFRGAGDSRRARKFAADGVVRG
jgi:hypothetical protein